MKRVLMIIMIVGSYYSLSAQSGDQEKFYFRGQDDRLDDSELDMSFLRGHFMGDEIAKKMYLLKESYTWVEEVSPSNPTPMTVVEKPAIYHSVRKLEKYYKKGIRKGRIDEETAIAQFTQILNIAITIRNQQTQELENFLDQLKEEERIVLVFTDNIEMNY